MGGIASEKVLLDCWKYIPIYTTVWFVECYWLNKSDQNSFDFLYCPFLCSRFKLVMTVIIEFRTLFIFSRSQANYHKKGKKSMHAFNTVLRFFVGRVFIIYHSSFFYVSFCFFFFSFPSCVLYLCCRLLATCYMFSSYRPYHSWCNKDYQNVKAICQVA